MSVNAKTEDHLNGNGIEDLDASLQPEAEPEPVGQTLAAYCTPLWDKLIVQADPEKDMSGGVVLPDAHRETPFTGVVLRVGEGRLLQDGMVCPPRVRAGDRIMFGRFAGIAIPDDFGKRIKMLREDEVLWVFPKIRNTAAESPEKDAAA